MLFEELHARCIDEVAKLAPSQLVFSVMIKLLEDAQQLALLLFVYQTSLELYH